MEPSNPTEKSMSERESLALIATMINKARDIYYDTGLSGILWGIVITVCALLKLSEIHYEYRLPFDVYMLTFFAFVPQILITIREKKLQRVKSYDDRFLNSLWMGFVVCIFLLVLIINMVFKSWSPVSAEYRLLTGHAPAFAFNEYIQPMFLMLYGLPTFITGYTVKLKAMMWGGLFCWACAVAAVFTPLKIDLLLTALAAIIAWFIPGIIAERAYRKAKRMEVLHV